MDGQSESLRKKKRRNPAIGSGSKGPASHVIEPNQKAQIEENIKILDSPSQDRSEVTSGQPNKSAQGQNVADNSKTSNDHTSKARNLHLPSIPSHPVPETRQERRKLTGRKKDPPSDQNQKTVPEPNLVFSSPRPLYFKVNYASDDRALEESFEEYKAGLYSDADQPEDTKSKAEDTKKKQEDSGYKPGSITAPLKIDERVLPKKIATVFDSLDKKIRYEAVVGMKPCRLHDFSDSTVKVFFQLWGEETVLGWDQENLDIALMARLALELNLHHKSPIVEFHHPPSGWNYMRDLEQIS
ncbi:hypothetical protein H4Q26_007407 [Puccinia striiformis f. sp. tritici PST-130]|nr:hypothetical protein H4Q26_007407 [Puccinia striiformis f. sp. tritici PST-130]